MPKSSLNSGQKCRKPVFMLVSGICFTKGNKQPQNSAFVINKTGNVLMKYSKVHTCDFAYENMVAVAMANPNGDNAGCYCAFSPICWDRNGNCVDNTVLLADDNTEGIFYAEFDMEAIREYRNREMLGNIFRKVEAYNQLLSKEIKEPFIREGQNR